MRQMYNVRIGFIGFACTYAFLGAISQTAAGQGTWMRQADMPTARAMPAAAALDGRIYVIGGAVSMDTMLGTVEMFDPQVDAWQRQSDMPTPRGYATACAVDGIIYVLGGARLSSTSISTVEAYNPLTDTWTKKADMPTPRQGLAACEVDDLIYVIGGVVQPTSPTAATEAYDPKANTWTTRKPMPVAAGAVSSAVVDGKIYVMGGGVAGSAGRATTFVYDPKADTWTQKADMPTARMGSCACALDGIIYVIGGTPYGGGPALATVEAYNPATNTWVTIPDMPTPRKYPAGAVTNGKLYVAGGLESAPVATVEVYSPAVQPPDFNGDGMVDISDLLRLIESWGQNDPSVDIAPPPFGDGVVDRKDLEALMSYWGQEISNPYLIAHWKLDEAGGTVASDSAGEHDGTVIGVPAWQPAGGAVDGALEFDGTTFVVTDSVLNPSDGAFSVFAWVKGGAPGQAILSQQAGANWLLSDPATGTLSAELKGGARSAKVLYSHAIITDGLWHRVGFAWDGSNRSLYVDDVLIAEDTQQGLAACYGDLQIGCGRDMAAGTFWSGLIDDVRIYSRAVHP
jgi:N-acetylneuraminic acid mutarotase